MGHNGCRWRTSNKYRHRCPVWGFGTLGAIRISICCILAASSAALVPPRACLITGRSRSNHLFCEMNIDRSSGPHPMFISVAKDVIKFKLHVADTKRLAPPYGRWLPQIYQQFSLLRFPSSTEWTQPIQDKTPVSCTSNGEHIAPHPLTGTSRMTMPAVAADRARPVPAPVGFCSNT